MCYTTGVCVFVALGSHIVICGLPRSTVFSTLCHKWQDYRQKPLNTECVLIFSTILSQTFFILRRIELDMIKKSILIFT